MHVREHPSPYIQLQTHPVATTGYLQQHGSAHHEAGPRIQAHAAGRVGSGHEFWDVKGKQAPAFMGASSQPPIRCRGCLRRLWAECWLPTAVLTNNHQSGCFKTTQMYYLLRSEVQHRCRWAVIRRVASFGAPGKNL
jgi:hypothetical protein